MFDGGFHGDERDLWKQTFSTKNSYGWTDHVLYAVGTKNNGRIFGDQS